VSVAGHPVRILVTGASGSGTSTVGRALSERLAIAFLDGDDYFWIASDPPFRQQRDSASRLAMLLDDLRSTGSAIVGGSIVDWGAELEDAFSLIVFLALPAAIRVARLEKREIERHGRADPEFIAWAAQYDEGKLPGRSRALHDRWLSERRCAVVRIEGDLSTGARVERIVAALGAK
jgi:adenylate kinase family enzyme